MAGKITSPSTLFVQLRDLMHDFGSRFQYPGLYDPEWVLNQIKNGFPNMNDADKEVALKNACLALVETLGGLEKAKRLAREICGAEE
jgi:hypothetical protein